MLTPAEVIRGTTTIDVLECLKHVNTELKLLGGGARDTVDYEEQITIALPHMLDTEEIFAFTYLLESAGWINVRVPNQTAVTFYFPSKA